MRMKSNAELQKADLATMLQWITTTFHVRTLQLAPLNDKLREHTQALRMLCV